MSKLVRLKPYNPRKGFVLNRYNYASQLYVSGTWYQVSDATAKELAEQVQQEGAHNPLKAFDVVADVKAAEDLEEWERQEELRQATPEKIVRVVGYDAPSASDGEDETDEDLQDQEAPKAPVKRGRPKKA